MVKRFFFAQDNSSHWYTIDASRRAEWDAWANLPEDDENGWDPPDFAERLDMHVQCAECGEELWGADEANGMCVDCKQELDDEQMRDGEPEPDNEDEKEPTGD